MGGLFQPIEGRGTLDAAYERILEIQQVQGTYKRLLEEGKDKEADALLDKYENKLVSANFSGRVREQLGKLATMRRNVIAADLTTAEKDEMLKEIDEQQVFIAREFLSFTNETRPQ